MACQAIPTPEGQARATTHFERSTAMLSEIGAENEEARQDLTWALEIFDRLGTLLEPDRVRETLRDLA